MRKFKVNVNGVSYSVEVYEDGFVTTTPDVLTTDVAPATTLSLVAPDVAAAVSAADMTVTAPLPGKVLDINVQLGEMVKKGDILMVLEAMKMENEIGSPADGTVKSVNVDIGQNVKPGQVLMAIH